jgi:hypothetical protein
MEATLISELTDARSRLLEQKLNGPAKFTFSLDGHNPETALLRELEHDVYVWRYDDELEREVPYFHGVIAQSEDIISEQVHTVNVTCHDYFAMLTRRYLTAPYAPTQVPQDAIVAALLTAGTLGMTTSAQVAAMPTAPVGPGLSLAPGSYLPLSLMLVHPDGTSRGVDNTTLRDRQYAAQASIGQLIDDLAHVIGGFDYDVMPSGRADPDAPTSDGALRIFWPSQGVTSDEPVLEYGGTIASVTRSVQSTEYGNYVRLVGNNASNNPNDPQVFAEALSPDANDVTRIPVGVWMTADNAADVSLQSTLDEQASGKLGRSSVLVPSYSVTLTPGTYREGLISMGGTYPLVVRSGRLDVVTSVRVVGMTYAISDNGTEDVGLTVGRPLLTLTDILRDTRRDVDALARR